MTAIGFRVNKHNVYYCIVNENEDENTIISKIVIPKAIDDPDKLSFIRNTILTIIMQYKINLAGIRLIEPSAQGKVDIFRANLEGVIQELFSDSTIEKYFLGYSTNVASLLGVTKQSIEDIFNNEDIFDDIRKSRKFSKEEKEAIVLAVASLNLK